MAEEQLTKLCTKCRVQKHLIDFSFRNKSKGYLHSECKICNASRTRIYYILNKEDCLKKDYEYRKANKQVTMQHNKIYYQENKDSIKERSRLYRNTLSGKVSKKNDNHKRRVQNNKGDVTTQQLLELQQSYKSCYWCETSLKNVKVNIDHYIPLSKGGLHTLSNLVVSCSSCNMKKNAKDPHIFANSIGKLL